MALHASDTSVRAAEGKAATPVNRMATLLLLATSELCAREVPLLYGPVLVASHDELDAPAGLSREQWRMLGGGPKVTWSDKWTLSCRVARDAPAPPAVGP